MPAEIRARVFNIQKYSIYDGPGIRTLIFLQGCPLRCLWCSNPEGQTAGPKLLFSRNLCTRCGACVAACPRGVHEIAGDPPQHRLRRENCVGNGACATVCPQRALALSGREMGVAELMAVVMEDWEFYETSGGGLTVGGGEPLMQPEALFALLTACREQGISTVLETSGHAPAETLARVAPLVGLFLYDLKHMDSARHRELTGVGNELILDNFKRLLDMGHALRVRLPLIEGCNADDAALEPLADFLAARKDAPGFRGVDILPYHRFGVQKYENLDMPYSLGSDGALSGERLEAIVALFAARGLEVAVVRH